MRRQKEKIKPFICTHSVTTGNWKSDRSGTAWNTFTLTLPDYR